MCSRWLSFRVARHSGTMPGRRYKVRLSTFRSFSRRTEAYRLFDYPLTDTNERPVKMS